MSENEKRTREDETPAEEREEAYEAPRLTRHGTVEELTRALGPGAKDGITGSIIL